MFYVKEITTAAGSTNEAQIKVWSGVIAFCSVRFPPGPQGLLKVSLNIGGWQFAPADGSESFASDNETISWQEFIHLQSVMNTITIKTTNDDDTLSHKCRVRINVLPLYIAAPYMLFTNIQGSLQTLLRRIGAV